MTQRLLRLPEVIQKVGYKSTAIHEKVKKGDFPAPISLGGRAVAWLESEIDAWIAERVNASRGGNHAAS